jgi:dihydrofolate reductase
VQKWVELKATMRRLRYCVAVSLDGFIAGPNGEYDWIIIDPAIDFQSFSLEFDTLLMGRRTFEFAGGGNTQDMRTIVCSKTLRASDHPNITITDDAAVTVSALKKTAGKDIWLFGGGSLFRSLLDAKLVDTIEVAIIPIALSQGIPLLPAGDRSPPLRLIQSKTLPTGTVSLTYAVQYGSSARKARRATKKPRRKITLAK